MNLTLRKLHGLLLNWYSPYISKCRHCNRNWNICEPHYTPYTERKEGGGSCFVYCEECFSELSAEEMLPAYKELILNWKGYGRENHNGISWDDLWKNVEINVLDKV